MLLVWLTFLPVFILYIFYQHKFKYWKKRNVYQIQTHFPLGSRRFGQRRSSPGERLRDIYEQTKSNPIVGSYVFCVPYLIVNDPDVIKSILVKDFMCFHDRGVYVDENNDPLAASLFTMNGHKWKNLRTQLRPTFTSGKMKMMFSTLVETGRELNKRIAQQADIGHKIDIKEILSRYTTDVISSCAFGIKTNSLWNAESEFRIMGKKSMENNFIQTFKIGINFAVPKLARYLKFRITKKEVEEFFVRIVKETIEYREQNTIERNDFLQLLIELVKKGYVKDEGNKPTLSELGEFQPFTVTQAAAQAFVFFTAGFETSSSAIQYALYELCVNQGIQHRAREEIDRVLKKYERKITYEAIAEMEYLDRIVTETLRKYPPLPLLGRVAAQDYKIPGTDVSIEEGTVVQIPVLGLHYDENYYPQPNNFDPDRWTQVQKDNRHHFAYLPFGEGPRNCIGRRFGLMQTKVGLVSLLFTCVFQVTNETPIPIVFNPNKFFRTPKDKIYLKAVRRSS